MDVTSHTPRKRCPGTPTGSLRSLVLLLLRAPVPVLGLALALTAAAVPALATSPPVLDASVGPVGQDIERNGVAQIEARLLRSGSRVGVLFDLAPGWHVYWRSTGDTGLPPSLSWQSSHGSVGRILWPAPKAFQAGGSEPDAASYGYEHQVLLASDLVLREGQEADNVSLIVDVDILACEYECVPVELSLARAAGQPLAGWSRAEEEARFEQHAALLPDDAASLSIEITAAWSQSAMRPGDSFRGAIGVRSCTRDDADCERWKPAGTDSPGGAFYPDDMESVTLRPGRVRSDRDDPQLHWLELQGEAEAEEPIEEARVTGLLAIENDRGERRHVEVDVPFPSNESGAEVVMLGRHWAPPVVLLEGAGLGMGLVQALLLALLGGLVLNLMPCVLPVLAIKVFSISEMAHAAHAGRGEPLRHGIAYTTGSGGSMLALGMLVVVLRAAGHSVGWGFQFQEPIYIAAISAVLVAFALNLFGTFEIRGGAGPLADLGQQATGARRSFFEGLLAVALATPCSAPFLGTAVGFAFASPPAVILGIFAAIGLGLAAPFALVAMVPAWARFMPRSGAWMQTVRSGLGFALLATVIWLLWIFGGSGGADGIVNLAAFLLLLAFSLWCFGLLQRSAHPRMTLAAGAAVLLLGGAGLNAVSARVEKVSATSQNHSAVQADDDAAWQPWSPDAVQARLRDGQAVFVRFTADWCITCKVNERVALADDDVVEALAQGGFALLVGDWTQRDEAIRSELSRHGRAGVPLYLLYDPQQPDEPRLLPELLTPEIVLAALEGSATAAAPPLESPKPLARTGR